MIRYIFTAALLVLIGFSGYQGYKLYLQKLSLEKDLAKVNNQLDGIYEENQKLVADLEYFKRPENLAKELKSRFNYVSPGEKLLIIPPKH
ncbi:MAG: septum formation initiator family protein [Patescibacteria group bacterium]